MVKPFLPEAGDIIWLNIDPQLGREQEKRRPALVLTDSSYNKKSGLCVVCPLTSKRKGYPFEVPVELDGREAAVLADQVKSLDWVARSAAIYTRNNKDLLRKVRAYVGVLLEISR